MRVMVKFSVLIGFFLMLSMFMGTVSAANWTVNPGDNIQSFITNASDNDTIIVNDNNGSAYTYTENLVINKKLQLQAKSGGNVTVQAITSSTPVFTVNSGGNNTTIQGFTITGATSSYGIFLNGASGCYVLKNNFTNNSNGIYISNSDNNLIQDNCASGGVSGISLSNCAVNTLSGNVLTNNNHGIDVAGSNNNIMTGNTMTNNGWGIFLFNGSSNNLIADSVESNGF